MIWKEIKGYRWPYRINEEACVQKQLDNGRWYTLKPYMGGGRSRAMVKKRTMENKPIEFPLVWLMSDAFLGGRRHGCAIIHRNGQKLDCAVENLMFMPQSECGMLSCRLQRKDLFGGTQMQIISDNDFFIRLRPCKATAYYNGEKRPVTGWFHGWAADFIEFEAGPGNVTLAIIEQEDGTIVTCPPDTVQFLDGGAPHYTELMMKQKTKSAESEA